MKDTMASNTSTPGHAMPLAHSLRSHNQADLFEVLEQVLWLLTLHIVCRQQHSLVLLTLADTVDTTSCV